MPHLTLEYSAGLCEEASMAALCQDLARVLREQREEGRSIYPLGGIRVRALRCDVYVIADGQIKADFLHANLKIGAGRSDVARKATGDELFGVITQHFAQRYQEQGLALSLEINEFSEAGTWKHNNLHALLKR